MSDVKHEPSHFLRIPPELRLHMYSYIVCRSDVCNVDVIGMPMHPILQTNKLIREEAFEAVHCHALLSFRLHDFRTFSRFMALHRQFCVGTNREHAIRISVDTETPRAKDGTFDQMLKGRWRQREQINPSVSLAFVDRPSSM
ncbi:hypothetical protein LTR36_004540 [Oleoguttula mirabilis]|uniref:Uncharacterized protein n=1 Tax=Oleoguttula mirabilis TaxID=1507867 RepID=A0AAV9JGU3_9PEZI|nr:hypothetical protein LTR36_004540 [Oleoguttula mirabilis]